MNLSSLENCKRSIALLTCSNKPVRNTFYSRRVQVIKPRVLFAGMREFTRARKLCIIPDNLLDTLAKFFVRSNRTKYLNVSWIRRQKYPV
jgi:hypothetical protein